MDRVKVLENKIKLIVSKVQELKDGNNKLNVENKFLQEETEKLKAFIKDNEKLREDKKIAVSKIEKLLKKINSIKQQ